MFVIKNGLKKHTLMSNCEFLKTSEEENLDYPFIRW